MNFKLFSYDEITHLEQNMAEVAGKSFDNCGLLTAARSAPQRQPA
jgi:hypothetical protein